ncbi:MAG: Asp-tRNA(Asn)/Glu-tRNA(Gln) amidotransferase subunit GatB [Candidatus Omnitrophota bacterium]
MKNTNYITTIGLEIHLQLNTKTKAFCGCANEFGREPNTNVCPVCLGLPGSLPALNIEYLKYAIRAALALNCDIAEVMKFDRKNYFYPDLPKNYQISQFDMPLSLGGYVEVAVSDSVKRIGITRVHMEEDAGKLIHDENKPFSYIDFNRCGTPLLEIVSEPDIVSPDEAYAYLTTLKAILEYLGISDCNMQEGSLRCDANISIRPPDQKELNPKVELKNMNTFKGVRQALEYEEARQMKLFSSGKSTIQETRLWDADRKATEPMRAKEEAHDYRYFPEPDLPRFNIDRELIRGIERDLPEMPDEKRRRFIKDYYISEYDSSCLVSDKAMAEYFEECLALFGDNQKNDNAKIVANWLMGDISRYLNSKNLEFKALREITSPKNLFHMLRLIDKGTISGKIAKDILPEMLSTGKSAEDIVKSKGLTQITDQAEVEQFAEEVITENQKVADDYIAGKDKALGFLVGALMKKTKGKANPQLANDILKKKLKRENG